MNKKSNYKNKKNNKKAIKWLLLILLLLDLTPIGKAANGHIENAIVSWRSKNTDSLIDDIQSNPDATNATINPVQGYMTVTFIDVGQGDATLIQTSSVTVLIDTGSHTAKNQLFQELENKSVRTIDYLLLTHPDEDHIGNGNSIIENYPVSHVLYPDVKSDTKAWEITETAIEEKGLDVEHPMADTEYSLGDASMLIITPSELDDTSKNNCSIGIKLAHGSNSFIMCGDAEEAAEKVMVKKYGHALEADVLKCSHHGSSSATSDLFLKYTDPTYAIISCGENNRYGHPHAEVISKLEDDDIIVYRTDKLGTITVISDGEKLSFSSSKHQN